MDSSHRRNNRSLIDDLASQHTFNQIIPTTIQLDASLAHLRRKCLGMFSAGRECINFHAYKAMTMPIRSKFRQKRHLDFKQFVINNLGSICICRKFDATLFQ